MRAIAHAFCLSVALVAATPAAGQLEDIRGLTFDASVDLVLNGSVLDKPLYLQTGSTALPSLPHSFDVLPDPAVPTDPAHILIRTRLPAGPTDTDEVRFELAGTFDAVTGEIEAAGVALGMHYWETPFATDAFGLLDADTPIWVMMRDPEMILHATVAPSVADTSLMSFDIVGGSSLGPFRVAADLDLHATTVSWLPAGADDPTQALFGPYAIEEAAASIMDLQATMADVFGDVNDDLLLTQADVVSIKKIYGPILDGDYEGDLVADGIVDAQDADLLQWLVRCIGNTDVDDGGLVLQGGAVDDGVPMAQKP